jgi:hypothetical protein
LRRAGIPPRLFPLVITRLEHWNGGYYCQPLVEVRQQAGVLHFIAADAQAGIDGSGSESKVFPVISTVDRSNSITPANHAQGGFVRSDDLRTGTPSCWCGESTRLEVRRPPCRRGKLFYASRNSIMGFAPFPRGTHESTLAGLPSSCLPLLVTGKSQTASMSRVPRKDTG